MNELWLYRAISNALPVRYPTKIMLVAFAGTHVPLLTLIGFFVAWHSIDLQETLVVLGVALAATLAGTGVTLFVLRHLLRPILMTSDGLRRYGTERTLPRLPLDCGDEVGTLMADASNTLVKLDGAIDELSNYDRLTGLPNQPTLLRRLSERSNVAAAYTLCALRFDNYERLLSTFGHGAGEGVLLAFVSRLEIALGRAGCASGALARLEGSLFAFVLEASAELPDAGGRAHQIASELSGELHVGELRFIAELTLGLSIHPADGGDPKTLLNSAIAALDRSPDDDAASVRFFSKASNDKARARFRIEHELRRALERDEFVLHYQPLVDLKRRTVIGAEALIRWNHPERGLLAPGAFIGVAEESGLIDPMSLWVLDAACRQMRDWSNTELARLRVSVNLSARQFTSQSVVAQIGDALQRSGVASSRLEIELTETAAVQDSQTTYKVLAALREMGVSAAIDDFGTGYSSMGYLKTLPFDKLKIDRAFVQNIDREPKSRAICRALVELSNGLGIQVLAEGTETSAEIGQLSAIGCALFQGYYFARPVAAEQLGGVIAGDALRAAMSLPSADPMTRPAPLWTTDAPQFDTLRRTDVRRPGRSGCDGPARRTQDGASAARSHARPLRSLTVMERAAAPCRLRS